MFFVVVTFKFTYRISKTFNSEQKTITFGFEAVNIDLWI